MSFHNSMSDAELDDIGMYRCNCGEAVYPQGDGELHCALDD